MREITPRRISSVKRKFKREQERLPLFAEIIAEEQPSPEQHLIEFEQRYSLAEQERRNSTAKSWRRARKIIKAMPDAVKADFYARHHKSSAPKTAWYVLAMLHTFYRPYYDLHG